MNFLQFRVSESEVMFYVQLKEIEGLQHLCDLRVLNLAGNAIEKVHNLAGLDALVELNLRRNRIRSLVCYLEIRTQFLWLLDAEVP